MHSATFTKTQFGGIIGHLGVLYADKPSWNTNPRGTSDGDIRTPHLENLGLWTVFGFGAPRVFALKQGWVHLTTDQVTELLRLKDEILENKVTPTPEVPEYT
jgi:hypothetical protein